MEILLWIGFAQSLFSATLFLFVKKEKSLANNILSAWLFFFALEFLTSAVDLSRGTNHLTNPFLIFNPLLYFYAKSLINPRLKLNWWQLWHILPYLFIKIGAFAEGVQLDYNDFYIINRDTWFNLIYSIVSVVSFFGYSGFSLAMVHRYRINLRNEFSTINSKITLGWLLIVIILYMSFMVAAYMLGIIKLISSIETFPVVVTYSFLLGMIYIFSFYGLLQQQLYSQDIANNKEKYKNPRLSREAVGEELEKLKEYFLEEKPYLDSELSIYILSQRMKLSRHTLTEVLNVGAGKNFYQFVNEYRVDEVKRKLKDTRYTKYSIDAIGIECGFKSKSSFYEVFKKYTGLTPTQFRSK